MKTTFEATRPVEPGKFVPAAARSATAAPGDGDRDRGAGRSDRAVASVACGTRTDPRTGGVLQRRGSRNFHAGAAAEEQVARRYERTGHSVRARRWRGAAGEIDLVLEKAGEIVFVEVKASATHATAAESLTTRQIRRLLRSAEDYLGRLPRGALTPMRFDVALVDRHGRLDIIPNALAA